ncbi:hypothetical protein BGW39_008856 [Mortierella sp. 14UC]|nr:hypothetical protein BGW39_008856 [Mortierella sp. 14UC]
MGHDRNLPWRCKRPLHGVGGTKMIVFGGAGIDGVAKAGIYILDVPSREWTVGKAADPTQARANMACAVAGDSFIAWGGESGSVIKDATPIVYDMKNNQWTTQFNRVIAATATSGSGPSATSGAPNTPESKTNIAAIGGGIAGAVVVIALIGFLFYRRRNSRHSSNSDSDNNTSGRSRSKFATGTRDRHDDTTGLGVRDPQNTNGDYKEAFYPSSGLPSSVLPILKPRPTDEREAFYSHLATSPSRTPPAGPHSVRRDPQGNDQQQQQQYFSPTSITDKMEWSGDNKSNNSRPSPSLIPARPPHTRDLNNTTTATFQSWSIGDGDGRSVGTYETSPPQTPVSPQFPRNPQTPISGQFGRA